MDGCGERWINECRARTVYVHLDFLAPDEENAGTVDRKPRDG
jgi:hypothetical protein